MISKSMFWKKASSFVEKLCQGNLKYYQDPKKESNGSSSTINKHIRSTAQSPLAQRKKS
jgi:hypothetical protein